MKINKSIAGTTVTDSEPVNNKFKFYKAQKCEIGYQDMGLGSPAPSTEDHEISAN